ncbi:macrodontain-1-like [Teleopsis dalmanni]|uniref:macrodontain-1-like n=1 Tax=Teleopsis dalmanni TaxID=139649 RepID=UPI0018CEBD7A|nr:macrodontain-1-like [Teleopsis dalmanni]
MLYSFGVVVFIQIVFILINNTPFATSTLVTDSEWLQYKVQYNKMYSSVTAENLARYNFNNNKILIDIHNVKYATKSVTYKLGVNQFTDMSLVDFKSLFPVAVYPTFSYDVAPQAVNSTPMYFNPIKELGIISMIEDQGTACNSGWAYAAAKSIELGYAYQNGTPPLVSLSAQNLIDCAGRSTTCKTQVPQTAFDFLSIYGQSLHTIINYPNRNTQSEQGMCLQSYGPYTRLYSYVRLNNTDDSDLLKYVGNSYPVVIEFNPASFEFMHYAEGVFKQPSTGKGSHFMVVIGYESDPTTGLNTWLIQNSFNTSWGENGYFRIVRNQVDIISKSAIYPIIVL